MTDSALLKKYGFKEEEGELEHETFGLTGFPEPEKRYRLIFEDYNLSVEERYFWVLDYLQEEYGFAHVDKITDSFAAAENSSFFGASQQRLGLQQDKVSNFLATIGKMTKELFQLVRELRIIDERMSYYNDSYSHSRSRESAEITLKGIWVDMVEQGSKNPASVYGMSRELGFATLPDLFFSIHPWKATEVDEVVDKLDFNRKVKEVLKRKLRTYLEWKEHTHEELRNKRRFTLKYLRQHFDIIKLYMNWVKPYLKNIRRLQMETSKMDSPEVISSFENAYMEIELLFRKKVGTAYVCIIPDFNFRTMPVMNYQQEYNRGPLHVGRLDLVFRGYLWTPKQVKAYKAMKKEEDLKLLSYVDNSVKIAMESLGDELIAYLKEAGEDFSDDPEAFNYIPKKESKQKPISDPFTSVFSGFGDVFKAKPKDPDYVDPFKFKLDTLNTRESVGKARKELNAAIWGAYKDLKKSFKLLNW